MSDFAKERARQLLGHYFWLFATRKEFTWVSDNMAETDEIIDSISAMIDDAIYERERLLQGRIDDLKHRLDKLEAQLERERGEL